MCSPVIAYWAGGIALGALAGSIGGYYGNRAANRRYSNVPGAAAGEARRQELTRTQLYRQDRDRAETRRIRLETDQQNREVSQRRMNLSNMQMQRRRAIQDSARSTRRSLGY